jgi:dihydroxy-acid dehydratase
VPEEELAARRGQWHAPKPAYDSGWLRIYRRNVSPMAKGGVLTAD